MQYSVTNTRYKGLIVTSLLQPLDVIKTNQQGSNRGSSIVQVVRTLISNKGVRSLYQGILPTIARGTLGPGVYFVCVEKSKVLHFELFSPPQEDFIRGALARAIASIITAPLSTMKARKEFDPSLSAFPGSGRIKDMFVGLGRTDGKHTLLLLLLLA